MAKNSRKRTTSLTNPILPPLTNPLEIRAVYTNNMDVAAGPLDVRLDFHELFPNEGAISRERRASVVMSVPHFKAMVKVLNDQLAKLDEYSAAFEKALAAKK
jgi:hypothetical protein